MDSILRKMTCVIFIRAVEMYIEITLMYYVRIRMVNHKKYKQIRDLGGFITVTVLVYCWHKYKFVQQIWKAV